MGGAEEGGARGFERFDLGPKDVAAAPDDAAEGGDELVLDGGVASGPVEEGDLHGKDSMGKRVMARVAGMASRADRWQSGGMAARGCRGRPAAASPHRGRGT